jgi:hypothetical protein
MAVASSRKNSSVKRPGASSGARCQPRKAQPAGDPAPARVATADLPAVVVQAAAVAVDQAARRIGDQLAERGRDPVAPRHDQ